MKNRTLYLYEDLANAIVMQAVSDYAWALSPTAPGKDHAANRYAKRRMREDVESFFEGGGDRWYQTLTNVPASIVKGVARKRAFTNREKRWLDALNCSIRNRQKKQKEV